MGGLRCSGFDLVLAYRGGGGKPDGIWRTVARLLIVGEPARAVKLASTLALTAVQG